MQQQNNTRDLNFAQRVSTLHENYSKMFSAQANWWGNHNSNKAHHESCRYVEASAKATKALFEINHDIYLLQNK
mgnify:CR=1 FL=1